MSLTYVTSEDVTHYIYDYIIVFYSFTHLSRLRSIVTLAYQCVFRYFSKTTVLRNLFCCQ
jgi:hypothetical protein